MYTTKEKKTDFDYSIKLPKKPMVDLPSAFYWQKLQFLHKQNRFLYDKSGFT